MDKQMKEIELREEHLSLLIHFRSLFQRINLRKNTYFFNQMKQSSTSIPFFVIAEERKVLQITHNQKTIKQTLIACELVNFNSDSRQVEVLELPCLKLKTRSGNQSSLRSVEEFINARLLQSESEQGKQKQWNFQNVEITVSKHANEEGYYYLMMRPLDKKCDIAYILKNGVKALQKMLQSFNVQLSKQNKIKYVFQDLYEDIKEGISFMKKTKKEMINKQKMIYNIQDPNKMSQNSYSQSSNLLNENLHKYNRMNPLPIFVRRAIPSDDSEQQPETQMIKVEETYDFNPSEQPEQKQETPVQNQQKGSGSRQNKNKKKIYFQKEFKEKPAQNKKKNSKKSNGNQNKASVKQPVKNTPFFDDNDFPSIG